MRFFSGLVLPLLFGVLSTYTKKLKILAKIIFKKITKTLSSALAYLVILKSKKNKPLPDPVFPDLVV